MKKTYPTCCKLALTLFFVFLTSLSYSQTPITQTFNSSGSFTVPPNVTSITIEAWGGGGKGGNKTTGAGNGGGGGGGGAYSRSTITVTPNTSYNYIVGAGSTTTAAGGDSSFGTSLVLAKGGISVANEISIGAVGGATTGVGDIKYAGGSGFSPAGGGGGGGGSSAGAATAGANATTANGATAPADGGNGGNGRTGTDGNGSAGEIPGGGGGGARRIGSGGNGANGQIRISYIPLYRAEFTAMSIGNPNWCPGETRTITVTVKNNGSATWTDSSPDINIGVKWNAEADYFVRTNANNLAPGASQTYSLTMTAPTGSTTNNLTFDVVNEGACWFGNNNGTCGPGNTVYTSPAINTFCFSNGPGGIVANLQLWLRADLLNGTNTFSDNTNVTSWQTQGAGSNATVNTTGQEPKFKNNQTDNVNFNAVVDFKNTSTEASNNYDYSLAGQQYLTGNSGYYTHEQFIVVIPNVTVNYNFGSMDIFCADSNISATANDATGVGFGAYSQRFNGEVLSYAFNTSSGLNSGYGVAETSTTKTYSNVGIINTRNNSGATAQELLYNCSNVVNTTSSGTFTNLSNGKYWIGRSEGWVASLDARVAEIITYSFRKNDASERNRIETYLAIKYGITLGVAGTSQNYVNPDGNVIWDVTANNGYNFNIAGIGRDDVSKLTQKQSRSSNSAAEVAIGLGQVATTNTANPNSFSINKQYLVWGSNNSPLTTSGTTTSVTLGTGATTSFIGAQRKYKIVETGGDVAETVVSLPKSSLSGFAKTGTQEYVLIVSSTTNFASADIIDIIPMTETTANYETWYDFDGTKFFTFGVANVSNIKYRADNNTGDFIVGERNVNLNTAFTVSAWIRTNSSGTFIAKNGAYQFYVNGSNKVVGNWNSADRIVSNTSINTGKYHYIAITFSGGTAKLYIDGVLDKTTTSQPSPISNTNNFSIGAVWASKGAGISSTFIGDIDEVRIWNSELTDTQLRYIMNQEILKNSTSTSGSVIPSTITKNDISTIPWSNLQTYYNMNTLYGTSIKDLSDNNRWARIKYLVADNVMIENQTAPLPYSSAATGLWQNTATWANGSVQTIPNSTSIVNSTIVDWNIVQTQNAVESQGNKTVLGLLVPSNTLSATGDTKIEVSHYLKIDGKIDLVGKSQLLQTLNSDLDVTSSGSIERDQTGKRNKFDYNYWSSPVGTINSTVNNGTYTVSNVFKDGTTTAPQNITWTTTYNGFQSIPITLSSYWIYKFQSANNAYANWMAVGQNGTLNAGQGYTLKGPGTAGTQNYTFVGKPNNGKIQFTIGPNLINLTGNPYASALNGYQFINDNLASTTGTLYFWDHFGGETHYVMQYQGGYATLNLTGGVPAQSHPMLQNVGPGTKTPKQFIPVGEGFFISSSATGGNIVFNNNQRSFIKEDNSSSFALMRNTNSTTSIPEADHFTNNEEDAIADTEAFTKIRLGWSSRNDYHRQVLLGFMDNHATSGIDPGYDATYIDTQVNDMYFLHGENKLVIQGDSYFNIENIYPVGVKCDAFGTVKFTIDAVENLDASQEVYIFDNMTGIYHSIKNDTFQIDLEAGTYDKRFSMRFTTQENLGTEDQDFANGISVAFTSNNNILHIKNDLIDTTVTGGTIFSILGQKLADYDTENQVQQSIQIPISNLSTGTYIVKIQTTNGNLSKKIIVK
jgi:hypothetical protein